MRDIGNLFSSLFFAQNCTKKPTKKVKWLGIYCLSLKNYFIAAFLLVLKLDAGHRMVLLYKNEQCFVDEQKSDVFKMTWGC